ncbi:MAG: hypothetical protein ACTHNK_14675 [Thermomicrobiales bacterium]
MITIALAARARPDIVESRPTILYSSREMRSPRIALYSLSLRCNAAVRTHLRAPYWWALLLLTAILFCGGYQARRGQTVHLGVTTDDKPYVVGMNAPEQAAFGQYRWTTAQSAVRLAGLGRGSYHLTLQAAGSANPHPHVTVTVNGHAVGQFDAAPGLKEYTFNVPGSPTTRGDVILGVQTTPFQAPNDRRELGVVLTRVTVTPTGDPGLLLPANIVWPLALLVLLAYLVAAVAGFGPLGAALTGASVAVGATVLLALNRPWLGIWVWTGGLTTAALTGLGLAVVLRFLLPPLYRLAGLTVGRAEFRWPVLLATLFFVAHYAGDLHPTTNIVDIGFHIHRFSDVNERGQLLLMVESREWGTRDTVYPPTAYLFMRPLQFFTHDIWRTVVLFMALAEATRLCLVYLVARKATADPRAGVFAAAVFGIVPMAYLPFSWGIATNVFGAWWTTALFAILVLGYDNLRRPALAALATLVATLALLSHPGEFVLAAASLGGAIMLYGVAIRPRFRGAWPALVAVTVVAGALAFALLYRLVAVDMLTKGAQTVQTKLSEANPGGPKGWQVGGQINDPIVGLKQYRVFTIPALIRGGLVGYWREAVGYYKLWPPLFALAALWFMRGTKLLARLRLASVLWWGVAVVFALAGLLLNVYVRYAYFLLPVIAVGAGLSLSKLTRAGRWGQVVTALLLTSTTLAGLWFWYLRITYDGH